MSKCNSCKSAYHGAWQVVVLLTCLFSSFRNSCQKMGVRLALEARSPWGTICGPARPGSQPLSCSYSDFRGSPGLLGLPHHVGEGEQGAQGQG